MRSFCLNKFSYALNFFPTCGQHIPLIATDLQLDIVMGYLLFQATNSTMACCSNMLPNAILMA